MEVGVLAGQIFIGNAIEFMENLEARETSDFNTPGKIRNTNQFIFNKI